MNDIDTFNFAMVGSNGSTLTIMNSMRTQNMSPDQALVLAAWLVSMAEPFAEHDFNNVLEAVQSD